MGDGEITGLPEGCISDILSLTSPSDCCRSAAVSHTFRSIADSGAVWDRFLPSDLSDLLSRAVGAVDFASKKELYFRLCDGILIDGSRMMFSLERLDGFRCYTLSARELNIVWGDDPRYWTWGPHQDSRNVLWWFIRFLSFGHIFGINPRVESWALGQLKQTLQSPGPMLISDEKPDGRAYPDGPLITER